MRHWTIKPLHNAVAYTSGTRYASAASLKPAGFPGPSRRTDPAATRCHETSSPTMTSTCSLQRATSRVTTQIRTCRSHASSLACPRRCPRSPATSSAASQLTNLSTARVDRNPDRPSLAPGAAVRLVPTCRAICRSQASSCCLDPTSGKTTLLKCCSPLPLSAARPPQRRPAALATTARYVPSTTFDRSLPIRTHLSLRRATTGLPASPSHPER